MVMAVYVNVVVSYQVGINPYLQYTNPNKNDIIFPPQELSTHLAIFCVIMICVYG